MKYKIGIGITAHNRQGIFLSSFKKIKQLAPKGSKIIVIDDASLDPIKIANYRFDKNVGIARAKNKCLELLDDCEHIFLFDDDTYPTDKDWHIPYTESDQPHLMYGFDKSLTHWASDKTIDNNLIIWEKPRGCMLYVENWVLDIVGGMSYAFGKYGHEHVNWSDRIYKAGLTKYNYADVLNPKIYCLDQQNIKSEASKSMNWKFVNDNNIPIYQEYRSEPVPVLIPRRADHDHRDRLYRFIKKWWQSLGNYKIIEGWHEQGDFNRSYALNLANRIAGNWQVAVIADADSYVDPEALQKAIDLSLKENRMVVCLDKVYEINQHITEQILRGNRDIYSITTDETENIRTADTGTVSLMVVVTRNVWEQAGGFDEKFVGWGGEDNAFWKCCELTTGKALRINTPAYHLWHKIAHKGNHRNNNARWFKYKNLTDRNKIQWILKS